MINIDSLIFIAALLFLVLFKAQFARNSAFFDDGLSLKNSLPVRGLAAICVIFAHTGVIPFWKHGYMFVGLFFFFSGYGLIKNVISKPRYLDSFLFHRFPSIIVPYYTMNIVYIVVLFFIGGFKPPSELLIKSFFIPFLKNGLFITSAWYVVVLCLLYAFFYFSFKKNKFSVAFFLTTIGIAVYCAFCKYVEKNIIWYGTTPCFLTGILYSRYENQVKIWVKRYYPFVILCSLALFIVFAFTNIQTHINRFIFRQIYTNLFIFVIILSLYKIKIGNTVSAFLGKISYELYLIHTLFVLLLNQSFVNVHYGNSVHCLQWNNHIGFVTSTILMSIGIAFVINKLNKKILNKLK